MPSASTQPHPASTSPAARTSLARIAFTRSIGFQSAERPENGDSSGEFRTAEPFGSSRPGRTGLRASDAVTHTPERMAALLRIDPRRRVDFRRQAMPHHTAVVSGSTPSTV
jgi:hypothetical protein